MLDEDVNNIELKSFSLMLEIAINNDLNGSERACLDTIY